MVSITEKSLFMLKEIHKTVPTCHFLQHFLYDIAESYPKDYLLTYVEIGCLNGATSCLLLQRPNTRVITIDLGTPVPKEQALASIAKLNIHNNEFHYIQGNSHTLSTRDDLRKIVNQIDILFIDGGHERADVLQDFLFYKGMVPKDGYIIFDDYNMKDCEGVKVAVDEIITTLEGFQIIGVVDNLFGAEGLLKGDTRGNEFVLRRL